MTDETYGNWQKYQSKNPIQNLLLNRFLDEVRSLVEPLPGRSILDAGCGEAFVLDMLLQARPDLEVAVGIDFDSEARYSGRHLSPHMPLVQARQLDCCARTRDLDIVVCTEVLEHFKDPDAALSELCRVSRKYCLLSVPHEPFFRLSNLLRGKSFSRLGNDIDHHQNWSQAGFVALLKDYLDLQAVKRSFPWQLALGQVRR